MLTTLMQNEHLKRVVALRRRGYLGKDAVRLHAEHTTQTFRAGDIRFHSIRSVAAEQPDLSPVDYKIWIVIIVVQERISVAGA